jgi:argininosuccinate synthase
MTNLKAFFDSTQKNVTGNVKMKVEFGNVLPVTVDSKYSLINSKIATYAQDCSWTKEDAAGFIKLY